MDPKSFSQRRPDGNGKWIWNLKGVDPVLYRLPEVTFASEVIIVEGEKDVDLLTELGFTATTCPMGAKKWRQAYNETLRDKAVILIPDNDKEGREHMAQVGAAIEEVVSTLKWIELPDLPSKGDVSDWVAKIGDKETAAERLAVMIESADHYEPPKPVSWDDAVLEDKEFIKLDLPEKKTIVIPWLPEQSITLISGWRGVGKTWFAMGLLDATTRGQSFGPWEINEPAPCLYLEGEMPYQDVRERFIELNPSLERKAPLHILSDAYANELGLPRSHLLNEKWRRTIKRILTTRKVKLWVLDNLASLASGIDENSKRDWDPINQWLLELRFAGIATVVLHHTNKEGDQRGTSAREDNIDCSILLKQPFGYVPEDGARFVSLFKKARVRTQDLPLIGDTQFQLCQDPESKQLTWTHGSVRKETRMEVLKLLDEGHKAIDIASMLGISRGRVSQITGKAHKDGHITDKGKLKQSGYRLIHGTED